MTAGPVSQDISDLFDDARLKMSRVHGRWKQTDCEYFNGGMRFGKLPQPMTYGIRVPFDRLRQFGELILDGRTLKNASREAGIAYDIGVRFLQVSGLPYVRGQRIQEARNKRWRTAEEARVPVLFKWYPELAATLI